MEPLIDTSVIIMLGVTSTLLTIAPLIALVILCSKKILSVKPCIFGALAFFLSQMVVRIPLLNTLSANESFVSFAQNNYILYVVLIGGLTAGLFEEGARFAGAHILKQQTMFIDAISFGLGHGICEAVMLVGMTQMNNLIAALYINNGTFTEMVKDMPQGTAESAIAALSAITAPQLLMVLWERVSAIAFHVFLTVLVFRGVNNKKLIYIAAAILFHTLFNSVAVLLAGVSLLASELVSFALAINGVIYIVKTRESFDNTKKLAENDELGLL